MACSRGVPGLASNLDLRDQCSQLDFTSCPTELDLPLMRNDQNTSPLLGMNKETLRPLLIQVLKREDELRLHQKVQGCYQQIGDDETALSRFTEQLQVHVCREFNLDPKVGIELIRSAISLYPQDEEIRNIPHYVRHNRCVEGVLHDGDIPPNCRVAQLDGTECSLLNLIDIQRPVVILAASHT